MVLGTAIESLQRPKPSFSITDVLRSDSIMMFSPTIPMSATPSATYSGMSSSRRKNSSNGKFPACERSLPSPLLKEMPHRLSSVAESSLKRPDF